MPTINEFGKIGCKKCGECFTPKNRHHVYCSADCASMVKLVGPSFNKASPSSKGAMTELIVAVEFMKNGWEVYRALSPASNADIIAIKNETILKIEVRTGYYYKSKDEWKLVYSKYNMAGKVLVVFTYSDNKIHYIGFEI